MNLNKDEIISAMVILLPTSGKHIKGLEGITSENLTEFLPREDTINLATRTLRARGFEIGPFIGISFSITGLVELFENFFGLPLFREKDGSITFKVGEVFAKELSEERLPDELKDYVQTIAFPSPPDFGPKEFCA